MFSGQLLWVHLMLVTSESVNNQPNNNPSCSERENTGLNYSSVSHSLSLFKPHRFCFLFAHSWFSFRDGICYANNRGFILPPRRIFVREYFWCQLVMVFHNDFYSFLKKWKWLLVWTSFNSGVTVNTVKNVWCICL